jgi:hypothetical protein
MIRRAGSKARRQITAENVPRVFDDACIEKLARIGRLPATSNKLAFAEGIREAARIYLRDASEPASVNELRDEIELLHGAADRRQYDQVAVMLAELSATGRNLLRTGSNRKIRLPRPKALRDAGQRDAACATILELCQYGGRYVGGTQRRSWQPILYAPERSRHFPRRQAEYDFVMLLQLAWLAAVGKPPTATVNPSRPDRPFANLLRECLKLVGTPYADHVGLINQLHRWRVKPLARD